MALGQEAYLTIPALDRAINRLDDKIASSGSDAFIKHKYEGIKSRYINAKNGILKYYTKTKAKHPELVAGKKNVLRLIDTKKDPSAFDNDKNPKIIGGYNFFDAIEDHRGLIVGISATVATYSLANTISLQVAGKDFTHMIIDAIAKSGLTAQAGAALGVMAGALAIIGAAYLIPAIRRNLRKSQKHRTAVKEAQNDILHDMHLADESLDKAISDKLSFTQEEFNMLLDDPQLYKNLRNLATSDSPRLTPTQRIKLKQNLDAFDKKYPEDSEIRKNPYGTQREEPAAGTQVVKPKKPAAEKPGIITLEDLEEARKLHSADISAVREETIDELIRDKAILTDLKIEGSPVVPNSNIKTLEAAAALKLENLKKLYVAYAQKKALAENEPLKLHKGMLVALGEHGYEVEEDGKKVTKKTSLSSIKNDLFKTTTKDGKTTFDNAEEITALKNILTEEFINNLCSDTLKHYLGDSTEKFNKFKAALKQISEINVESGKLTPEQEAAISHIEGAKLSDIIKTAKKDQLGMEEAIKKGANPDLTKKITGEKLTDEEQAINDAIGEYASASEDVKKAKATRDSVRKHSSYEPLFKRKAEKYKGYKGHESVYLTALSNLGIKGIDAESPLLEGENLLKIISGLGILNEEEMNAIKEGLKGDDAKKADANKKIAEAKGKINEAMAKKLGLAAEAEGPGSGK